MKWEPTDLTQQRQREERGISPTCHADAGARELVCLENNALDLG